MKSKTEKKSFLPILVNTVLLLGLMAGFSATLSAAVEEETDDKVTYTVTGDVYYGDKNTFKKPCVLQRSKIFAKIPAYQAIKREKLKKDSARYAFLLKEANRVFRETIEKVAEEKGVDLVVEKGGIKASKGVRIPVITKAVIKALPK